MIDVTVIIPTYNRRQCLPVALDSVFRQLGVQVECIVVDDGSDDGTVDYIRTHYEARPLIVIEKPRRSGPQASRNLGMGAARGEFITFLDSDDFLEPNTLAERVRICRRQNLDALFSGYRIRFVGRRWDLVKNIRAIPRACYIDALRDFKITQTSAIMYRREACPDLQLDEGLVSGHDDDLSLHLIRTCRFAFDDAPASNIIQHVGEHVATPRNLMIGDAQLLQKYAADIAKYHGQSYLTRRRAYALAGLWSVGQFKHSGLVRPQGPGQGSMIVALFFGALYLPQRILRGFRTRVMIATARAAL